jgi:hypothetical protein
MALDIFNKDLNGTLQMKDLGSSLEQYFYLRESQDFVSAFDNLQRMQPQIEIPPPPDVFNRVILYRGLEILLNQGFDSLAYQQLLKHPHYRNAIEVLCSNEHRQAFALATVGLNVEHLGMLYEAETYFLSERSKKLQSITTILPTCRNLLNYYISWWLDGKGLQMDECCIAESEASRCTLLFRALYCSLLIVGSCAAGNNILQTISEKGPAGTPEFEGDDLWMMRVASNLLHG